MTFDQAKEYAIAKLDSLGYDDPSEMEMHAFVEAILDEFHEDELPDDYYALTQDPEWLYDVTRDI